MRHGTGHPRLEDRLETREPHVVQVGGPNPRMGKMQMVLVTLPKLHGPMSRLMARKPCVQKVILRIRKRPHGRMYPS